MALSCVLRYELTDAALEKLERRRGLQKNALSLLKTDRVLSPNHCKEVVPDSQLATFASVIGEEEMVPLVRRFVFTLLRMKESDKLCRGHLASVEVCGNDFAALLALEGCPVEVPMFILEFLANLKIRAGSTPPSWMETWRKKHAE